MKNSQWKMKSPVGPLFLTATPKGLQSLQLKKQDVPMLKTLNSKDPSAQVLAITVLQLNEYFQGHRTEFDLPLDLSGTKFQKKVWTALSKIPFGKSQSYQDIAKKIKHQKAVRAVGGANGKNPVAIIIPCHRVIAASGKIGGYSGGLPMKRALLKLEKITVIN